MSDQRSDLQRELEAATSRSRHGSVAPEWERRGVNAMSPTAGNATERGVEATWADESLQWREGWTALVQLLEDAELDAGSEIVLPARAGCSNDWKGIEEAGDSVAERSARQPRGMSGTAWRGGGSLLLLALTVGCGIAGWAGLRWSLDRPMAERVAGREAAVETRALVAMVPRSGSQGDAAAADRVVRDPTAEEDSGWDESAWSDSAWETDMNTARVALWQAEDGVGESAGRWSSMRDQLAWMEQELARESL
ncbi:MAG: hypothetical protein AB7O38_15605 [Pirellulaceae bacterium]